LCLFGTTVIAQTQVQAIQQRASRTIFARAPDKALPIRESVYRPLPAALELAAEIWANLGIRGQAFSSLDQDLFPRKSELLRERQRCALVRVWQDKTAVFDHYLPKDLILKTHSLSQRLFPLSKSAINLIMSTFCRPGYTISTHSFRRTFAISLRKTLEKLQFTESDIRTVVIKRINKYVGWSTASVEYFKYCRDWVTYRDTPLLKIHPDVISFITNLAELKQSKQVKELIERRSKLKLSPI